MPLVHLLNKIRGQIKEDAPTNNVGSGHIAGALGDPPISQMAYLRRNNQNTQGKLMSRWARRWLNIQGE
jgi:hypothetical protein